MPEQPLLRRAVAVVLEHSLLLVGGALAGLVWANLALPQYEQFAGALRFIVNDVGMTFFFAIATKEVFEATLPGGPLASWRQAAVPLISAAGGMLVPALIFVALAHHFGETTLARGWAIPCATDIAFSYMIARFIFSSRHPAIPFLLLLAIADDALGLFILALFYPTGEVRLGEFAIGIVVALVVAGVLRRAGVRSFWPYILVAGGIAWIALERGGLHPALALVPIVPFLPHARRGHEPDIQEQPTHDALNEFEHWWKTPVEVILFFFGLVNAGVPIASVGPGTWFVLAGLIVGKPIGIFLSTELSALAHLHWPSGLTWRDMLVVGAVAGVGFTVALFFTTAAFPPGLELDQTKMGALLSFGAVFPATALAMLLGVGRFGRAS
ncbi:MAG TPA: Na+/H+ antiporter NhaA [Vicinamibacterales bacterium]|jgi:NhaA family Na+:H+ antiporter